MSEDGMTAKEYNANRIAAGRLINVETCEIAKFHVDVTDPYGVNPGHPAYCYGGLLFVASGEGWVFVGDLPADKQRALDARIDRAEQTPTTAEGVRDVLLEEQARAVARLEEHGRAVVGLDELFDRLSGNRFLNVPFDIVRCGIGLALAKLGKEGTPLQERLERKFRRPERERRANPPMVDI